MDPISVSGRYRLKIVCTPCWGEAGYHDHGVVEAQGSSGSSVDLVDVVQKCGVQHHQGEDNVRFVEGAVEYVRETIGYE